MLGMITRGTRDAEIFDTVSAAVYQRYDMILVALIATELIMTPIARNAADTPVFLGFVFQWPSFFLDEP